jgi:hypothetical protein
MVNIKTVKLRVENLAKQGTLMGKYHCTVNLLFD